MNKLIILFIYLIPCWAAGQFSDNFSDGELQSNPKWQGQVNDFEVDGIGKLHLYAEPLSSSKTLYTKSSTGDSAHWSFEMYMDFNTSSANYCIIFLAAESTSLNETNTLYAQLGGTKDNIEIWQRYKGYNTLLLETEEGIFDRDSSATKISISLVNNTLSLDTGFTSVVNLTSAAVNYTPMNTSFFGIQPVYTSSRSKKFWFDNFNVKGNTEKLKPVITSQIFLGSKEIRLEFSEAVNTNTILQENFLLNGVDVPLSISVDSNTVSLLFDADLQQPRYNAIAVSGIKDMNKNTINDTSIFVFCGVTSPPQKGDVIINEIMANPRLNPLLPEEEFIEIFNASEKAIALNTLQLINGQSEQNINSDTILLPQQYYTICATENIILFKNAGVKNLLGASSFSALNNSHDSLTIIASGLVIDAVSYNTEWLSSAKSEGGFSLERINPKEACNNPFNFAYCVSENQATPSNENSVYKLSTETIAILTAAAQPDSSIILQSTEAIDALTFDQTSVKLNGKNGVSISQNLSSPNTYTIYFSEWPIVGETAEVIINDLRACNSSTLDSVFQIPIPKPTAGNELRITELMVDPSPPINLPNAEYIELYNTATYAAYLSGFELVYNEKHYALPNLILPPNSYHILISESDTGLFFEYQHIGLSSFPVLSNNKGSVSIVHKTSGIKEEVHFNNSYYKDSDKTNGGHSLENIRPTENCLGQLNFYASQNPNGGTPGASNSVYATGKTQSMPQVLNAIASNDTVTILFDRNIEASNSFNLSSITFEPSIPFSIVQVGNDSLLINTMALDAIFNYRLRISEIMDCLGNFIDTTIQIEIAKLPVKGDIIITEVMADPTPNEVLPEIEYLELYNTQDFPLLLNTLSINGIKLNTHYILSPKSYVLLAKNADAFGVKNAVSVPGFSSTFLTNSEKNIVLKNDYTSEIVTQLTYSNTWHNSDMEKAGGVSLELTLLNLKCYNSSLYWKSSASAYGGTPGAQNSVSNHSAHSTQPTLVHYHNSRLSLAFSCPVSLDSIDLSFQESLDSIYLSDNEHLLHLKLLDELPTEERNYEVSVKQCNNLERIHYSELLKRPETPRKGDLLTNEILYDAGPNQNEFIELYNPTSKYLSLYNLRYSLSSQFGILDSVGVLLRPKDYLLLASDTSRFSGFSHKNELVYYPFFQLPNLPNQGLEFSLISGNNDTIDFINVSDDLHYPLLINTTGVALERIYDPNLNEPSFISAPQSYGHASPGLQNAAHGSDINIQNNLTLSDTYLSANGDGHNDHITITYTNNALETINLTVYDRLGFEIKNLAKNYIHSATSSFVWIGDNNSMQLTEAGIYIIVLDVISAGSTNGRIKKTITLSR
jgi:hypothetical protein